MWSGVDSRAWFEAEGILRMHSTIVLSHTYLSIHLFVPSSTPSETRADPPKPDVHTTDTNHQPLPSLCFVKQPVLITRYEATHHEGQNDHRLVPGDGGGGDFAESRKVGLYE